MWCWKSRQALTMTGNISGSHSQRELPRQTKIKRALLLFFFHRLVFWLTHISQLVLNIVFISCIWVSRSKCPSNHISYMFTVWHWSRSSHWFTDPKSESLVVTGADYHMGHQAVWGKSAQGAFTTGTKVGKRHPPPWAKQIGHLLHRDISILLWTWTIWTIQTGHFSECPQIIFEACWFSFCIFVPILLIWAPSPLRKHTKLKSYFSNPAGLCSLSPGHWTAQSTARG